MTFHGPSNAIEDVFNNAHESPKTMSIPIGILAFGSIFSGIFLFEYFINPISGMVKDSSCENLTTDDSPTTSEYLPLEYIREYFSSSSQNAKGTQNTNTIIGQIFFIEMSKT